MKLDNNKETVKISSAMSKQPKLDSQCPSKSIEKENNLRLQRKQNPEPESIARFRNLNPGPGNRSPPLIQL